MLANLVILGVGFGLGFLFGIVAGVELLSGFFNFNKDDKTRDTGSMDKD